MVERKIDNLEVIGSSPIMPNQNDRICRCIVVY